MDFRERLDNCKDFDCILKLVRECTEKALGKKRVGLMLGLADLPPNIGAFHPVPSNLIVLNRSLIKGISVYDKKLVNSYVFYMLLHEYLHSLGFLEEDDVWILCYSISKKYLGERHPTMSMIKYGIGSVFPELYWSPEPSDGIEIISNIEEDDLSYIG